MFDILLGNIADYWFLATYFGTMLFNENAILTAFSFSAGGGESRYWGIALAAGMGTLTNDLVLYAVARFGLLRFVQKKIENAKQEDESFFERLFLRNVFLSIVFLKFLFGMRTVLTLYLVVKKRISFPVYFFYNLCGIVLYISVLALVGWFIGIGVGSILGVYNMVVKTVLVVATIIVLTHVIPYVFKKIRKSHSLA